MRFIRDLSETEASLLGDDPEKVLNNLIDETLRKLSDPQAVRTRILLLMSTSQVMNARQIVLSYNAIHGVTPITIGYARYILADMTKAGLIKRKSRGKYVK